VLRFPLKLSPFQHSLILNTPARVRMSLLYSIRTVSEVHPASCPICEGGALSLGLKGLGREADHSPPSSVKAKNDGAITPLLVCLHIIVLSYYRDNCTLPLPLHTVHGMSLFQGILLLVCSYFITCYSVFICSQIFYLLEQISQ
jgi:hypothetical protein